MDNATHRRRRLRALTTHLQWGLGVLVIGAAVAVGFLHDVPDHSERIDRANLDLAAAKAEHHEARTRWDAALDVTALLSGEEPDGTEAALSEPDARPAADRQRDRQAELVARHGQAVLVAAHAELHAGRMRAYAERISRMDLAVEQLRSLVHPAEAETEPPLQWPVEGAVVSGYGLRAWPDFGRMHPGIDIVNVPGTPIGAAADGVVVAVRKDRVQGNSVVIDHGTDMPHPGRWSTVYGHLDEITVTERERIRAGEHVGTLGNTGQQSTGPHLHFEVRIEDQPVEPRRWLP